MRILTEDADLRCDHVKGIVKIEPTQDLVTVNGRCVLVEDNPVKRSIKGCPFTGLGIKPCQVTHPVEEGYSDLLTIDSNRVCLDSLWGKTDGVPLGFKYSVREAGQDWIDQA